MKTQYYCPIEVWSRLDAEKMECYVIFQRISNGAYAVQSKDTYESGSITNSVDSLQKQRSILFMEEDIEKRGIFKPTIEGAIRAFDNSF